jgi:hypothetical protein
MVISVGVEIVGFIYIGTFIIYHGRLQTRYNEPIVLF